jgi:hypothetical protein
MTGFCPRQVFVIVHVGRLLIMEDGMPRLDTALAVLVLHSQLLIPRQPEWHPGIVQANQQNRFGIDVRRESEFWSLVRHALV